MDVTVDVVGGDTHEMTVTNETYAELLEPIGFSPHEVAILVDGQPVPEDQPVDAREIRVLRMIKGGSSL